MMVCFHFYLAKNKLSITTFEIVEIAKITNFFFENLLHEVDNAIISNVLITKKGKSVCTCIYS